MSNALLYIHGKGDSSKETELLKPFCDGYEMYYKEGVTDPDYCVLRFTAAKGRYYSNFKSVDFDIE